MRLGARRDPLPAAGAVLHVTFGPSEQMSRGEKISPAGFERARTKERNESCHERRTERFEEEEKTGQEAVCLSIWLQFTIIFTNYSTA